MIRDLVSSSSSPSNNSDCRSKKYGRLRPSNRSNRFGPSSLSNRSNSYGQLSTSSQWGNDSLSTNDGRWSPSRRLATNPVFITTYLRQHRWKARRRLEMETAIYSSPSLEDQVTTNRSRETHISKEGRLRRSGRRACLSKLESSKARVHRPLQTKSKKPMPRLRGTIP